MRNFEEINTKEVSELTKVRMKGIGRKVRRLRTEAGLSLVDVSFYCYLNLDLIYRLENGRINNTTLLTLMKLSTFFKTDLFNSAD